MPVLHMETDQVRQAAHQLYQAANTIREHGQSLTSATQALDWHGSSRDMFTHEISTVLQTAYRLADEGDTLSMRLLREVEEWEQVDGIGTTSTTTTPTGSDTPWYYFLEGHLARLEGKGKFFEYDKRDGKWHGEPEIGIKYALFEEDALFGDPDADGFSAVGGRADFGVSVNQKGVSAGLSGEYYTVKGQADTVLGDKNLAFTPGIEAKALAAEGFIGIKDNSIGATIGGTLVSVEGEVGANIAGANVGLTGEIGLKAELGFQIGKETKVKLPFVTIGFTFGKAKED
jgi:uncharacterized protein YukE